ncbi:hypothetical protein L596_005372 [Steinernema carpocapsae]|uniref:Oligopeptide transporter 1 n=1 Tax=Steinernema carpocapsae TaxID=34508 RepID=A0A4U8UYT4_STECR|nr:hypothetical protein L596_005372 [Steinernema carpocapsae]
MAGENSGSFGSYDKNNDLDDRLERSKTVLTPQELDPEPTTMMGMFKRWPKSTFCIISNEFCERFSFYGMRAVLTLYLINILKYSNEDATLAFHSFIVICYFSPIIGSCLADGMFGKFWTILSLSIIYGCGNVVTAVASVLGHNVHPWMDFLGLFIIGIGTGGIKPCVSSFGADQFAPHHTTMISFFFSVFYFCINAGSTIAVGLTPKLRTIPCMGHDSCYPLAFGLPAVFMLTACLVFAAGSYWYKKVPPKENVIKLTFLAVCKAIFNFFRNWGTKREHWMDHYLDGHKCENDAKCMALAVKGKRVGEKCAQQKFVADIKTLVRVSVVLIPTPFFWALYDQQGSTWIIQAVAMDSQVWKGFDLLPDQMSIFNAILVMALIPIFQSFIYPGFEKCGIRTTAIRRMVIGGFLAAASFGACGILQLKVNQTLPDEPPSDMAFVSVINAFPNCNVSVTAINDTKLVGANSSLIDDKVKNYNNLFQFHVGSGKNVTFDFAYSGDCFGYTKEPFVYTFYGGKTYYVTTTPRGYLGGKSKTAKPQKGQGESSVSLSLLLPCSAIQNTKAGTWDTGCNMATDPSAVSYSGKIAACEFSATNPKCDPRNKPYFVWKEDVVSVNTLTTPSGNVNMTSYAPQDLYIGLYQLFYVHYKHNMGDRTPDKGDIDQQWIPDVVLEIKGQGGVYLMTIEPNPSLASNATKNIFNVHQVVPKNKMSILWQIPQYALISSGEVLFSITGLEFSYGQAAPSMKSVVTAVWLLMVAIGDTIIIILDKSLHIKNLASSKFKCRLNPF